MLCRILSEFGWSVEYALTLTCPVFMELYFMIDRLHADRAIDVVYSGYAAAKYGGESSRELFRRRGELFREESRPLSSAAYDRAYRKAREVAGRIAAGEFQ